MRLAVVVAGVALDAVLDVRFTDFHHTEITLGFVALLLQPEPDSIFAGLGEAGQRCAVCAVLGGRVGHAYALGGDVQRNRVRLAVIVAIRIQNGTTATGCIRRPAEDTYGSYKERTEPRIQVSVLVCGMTQEMIQSTAIVLQ